MRIGIREIVLLAVLLALPLLSWWLVFRPQNNEIAQAKREIEHKRQMLDKLKETTARTQDLQRENVPVWGYFCQISDSTTSYGSYSGAVPNEKITWGKLEASTPKFIVESDASIVAPLMFAYILGW